MSDEAPTAADLKTKACDILEIAHGIRHIMRDQPALLHAYEMLTKATTKLAGQVNCLDSHSSFEQVLNALQDMAYLMGMCQISAEFMKLAFKLEGP